jgi:hypothetical protein
MGFYTAVSACIYLAGCKLCVNFVLLTLFFVNLFFVNFVFVNLFCVNFVVLCKLCVWLIFAHQYLDSVRSNRCLFRCLNTADRSVLRLVILVPVNCNLAGFTPLQFSLCCNYCFYT